MSVIVVELGELCEFLDNKRVPVAEELRKPGPYPYFGANGQQGWIDAYLFDEPLVLLAEDGGQFGSKSKPIAYKITGKSWVNNHAHVLRPRAECNIDYLHRILSVYDVTKFVSGTTRLKLTKGDAERIPIPLPPLSDQRRIAAILDKADRLRRLRRYALQLSDTYLQSVFVQMFGDPKLNTMGWGIQRLEELVRSGDTINYGVVQPGDDYAGGIPIIRVGDFDHLATPTQTIKQIDPAIEAQYKRSRLAGDEVLIACVGHTLGKIALAREWTRGLNIVRAVARVPLGSELNRFFLATYLSLPYIQEYFNREARTVAQPTLNILQIQATPVYVPPIPLQQQFAQIVQKHERLRTQQREALRQAEHLFQTLLHQAFTGALSRDNAVPEHDEPNQLTVHPFSLNTPTPIPHESLQQASLPFD